MCCDMDPLNESGNVRAVALYNPSDTICNFTVPMNILELGGKVKARDLMKQQDLPEIKGCSESGIASP